MVVDIKNKNLQVLKKKMKEGKKIPNGDPTESKVPWKVLLYEKPNHLLLKILGLHFTPAEKKRRHNIKGTVMQNV